MVVSEPPHTGNEKKQGVAKKNGLRRFYYKVVSGYLSGIRI